jgi:CBS domain containing-hemolysin-like protein
VVDKNQEVIGIVTRQDIYEPLMPGVNPLYKRRDMDETTLAEWHDLGDY